ncbi:hypothetical protein Agub_g1472, partial [Astrephomene gubernaculifera]
MRVGHMSTGERLASHRASSVTPWRRLRTPSRLCVVSALPSLPPEASLPDKIASARQACEAKHPPRNFSVAGVTFEGRQKLIKDLQPEQIVLLEREPWNQYDPDAVRVMDLMARTLGYIPRYNDQNKLFTQESAFGLVNWTGTAPTGGSYGARLYARPSLPNLVLDPLLLSPDEAARLADLPTL